MQAEGKSFSGYERHCAFLNTGQTQFANVSATSGLDLVDDGRGVAYVDWDHDGDLDLWLLNRTSPQVRFLRNEIPRGHFIAVRLVGTTCNRDAIGARVELHLKERQPRPPSPWKRVAPNRETSPLGKPVGPKEASARSRTGDQTLKLVKTLYAGHGTFSQSSKWLHFGLGSQLDIDGLTVRWPGGGTETFTGIVLNQRFKVVEGTGRAVPWSLPDRDVKLVTSRLKAQPPTTAGRVFLAVPVMIPILTCQDWDGNPVSINDRITGPTLINLWASWCLPCHAELKELVRHAQALRQAGLGVFALSVDGLDDAKATRPADAQSHLERMNFPFDSGLADSQMLSKLQLLHNILFFKVIPLAVPTSLLIDGDGQLAAIYRGPLSVDQLMADVQNLKITSEQRLELASRFPGRWAADPVGMRLDLLAQFFDRAGFVDDALAYYRQAIKTQPDNASVHLKLGLCLKRKGQLVEAMKWYRQALRLDATYVQAYNNLGVALQDQGRLDEAIQQYRQVLQLDPQFTKAHYNLAVVRQLQGKLNGTIRHLRAALRINPYFAQAHYRLGTVLRSEGRLDEAIDHLRQAVRIKPTDADAHYQLGLVLEGTGQPLEALDHYRQALRHRPDVPEVLNSTAWLLATHPDVGVRDSQEAIRLAQRANVKTENRSPSILDTLAVAQAAAGHFDRAVASAQRAIELATTAGRQNMADEIRRHLELFKQGKTYEEGTEARRQEGTK